MFCFFSFSLLRRYTECAQPTVFQASPVIVEVGVTRCLQDPFQLGKRNFSEGTFYFRSHLQKSHGRTPWASWEWPLTQLPHPGNSRRPCCRGCLRLWVSTADYRRLGPRSRKAEQPRQLCLSRADVGTHSTCQLSPDSPLRAPVTTEL